MPKFRVNARVSGSKHLGEFEAATFREAIDMALAENGGVSLCHQCCGECEDGEVEEDTCVAELDEESATPAERRSHEEAAALHAIESGKADWQVGIDAATGDKARKRLVNKGAIRWNKAKKTWVVLPAKAVAT